MKIRLLKHIFYRPYTFSVNTARRIKNHFKETTDVNLVEIKPIAIEELIDQYDILLSQQKISSYKHLKQLQLVTDYLTLVKKILNKEQSLEVVTNQLENILNHELFENNEQLPKNIQKFHASIQKFVTQNKQPISPKTQVKNNQPSRNQAQKSIINNQYNTVETQNVFNPLYRLSKYRKFILDEMTRLDAYKNTFRYNAKRQAFFNLYLYVNLTIEDFKNSYILFRAKNERMTKIGALLYKIVSTHTRPFCCFFTPNSEKKFRKQFLDFSQTEVPFCYDDEIAESKKYKFSDIAKTPNNILLTDYQIKKSANSPTVAYYY